VKLIGISGSLRRDSWNTQLLHTAQSLLPNEVALEIASIADVPLFNQDLEVDGLPPPVKLLRDDVHAADGLVIATPEYNLSMPGVLKNTLDWLSRPIAEGALTGKRVMLMGTTPGRFGTAFAQSSWLTVFWILRMQLWMEGGAFLVNDAANKFKDGHLADPELRRKLEEHLMDFVGFIERN
jgi:NAD(P)H-dependent FMN reductase